jgi:SAM-dependent methyltransferase
VYVSDPRVDFEEVYDERYYRGQGADPLIDYVYEAQHPDTTIRRHEWRGILKVVSTMAAIGPGTRWLDYGCGTGGLVSYLHQQGLSQAIGFEPGWSGRLQRESGRPHATSADLDRCLGTFDVVTLIEVIEHVIDPVAELARVRSLLRPGGLCFLTTGNAGPFRDRMAEWSYVQPDVHVSYFEPESLAIALERAGFDPFFPGYREGWQEIIRFKILKRLHRRSTGPLSGAIPWSVVSRYVDRRLRLSAHPVGQTAPGPQPDTAPA